EPFAFLTPVDVGQRHPGVDTATGKAEGLEAHGFERDVAGQDEQVSPGNTVAVLLLERPEQATGLVEVDVVRPGIERGETLLACATAATSVLNAIGTGSVPGHADHRRTIVAPVCRPPVLAVGHQLGEVSLQALVVELLELFGIVEVFA